MRNERLWALVLVTLQCGLIGFVSGGVLFAIIVMAIAGFGTFTRFRISLRPERQFIWTAVCVAFFLLKYRLSPVEFSADQYFIRTDLMHEMARCLVFIQAAQFLIRYPKDQLPLSLPALGAGALVCASDVEMGPDQGIIVGVLAVAYALGWAMFQMAWRQRGAVEFRAPSDATNRRALRLRVITLILVFLGLVFSTGAIARSVVRYHRPIDEWLVRQVENWLSHWIQKDFGSSTVGFSERANLNAVQIRKTIEDETVALRVFAEREPGYLRGQVYVDYILGEWRSPSSLRYPLYPQYSPPSGLEPIADKGSLFRYPKYDLPTKGDWRSLECWRDESLKGFSFSTIGTTHLQAQTDELRYRRAGLFDLGELPPGTPYVAWELTGDDHPAKQLVAMTEEETTLYTGLSRYYQPDQPARPAIAEEPEGHRPRFDRWQDPRSLPPDHPWPHHGFDSRFNDPEMMVSRAPYQGDWLGKVADVVFDGCETTAEKMAAVERYFHRNYEYQLGIDIPEEHWHDPDPLQFFLDQKPPAHCEYFATAAVVLLRRAGVPARYVTGFVVSERNEIGNYWVARNRDAHAWCEAFDPERGWVIVEATPAGGVPQSVAVSGWRQWWEELKAAIVRLQVHIGDRNWSLVWRTLWGSVTSVFTALIFIGLVYWLYKRLPWRLRWKRAHARSQDQWELALENLLQGVERDLQPLGWKRSASETLHQFALRLARPVEREPSADSDEFKKHHAHAFADWLRAYALQRYTKKPDESMVLELQNSRPQL
ncbi:transglutaminase-like domain-containing protein [Thalassoroseus pseudoceratinae]|uniref:transglutaminase-like domain-containing protein n=1 Tax=Thalassoroseus pseudoceratinae TaxID=2713176 RepID=UPI00198028E9|nr:transglutaminase-like domain-containing protein [Thalassoroseus pseudoceratinae]